MRISERFSREFTILRNSLLASAFTYTVVPTTNILLEFWAFEHDLSSLASLSVITVDWVIWCTCPSTCSDSKIATLDTPDVMIVNQKWISRVGQLVSSLTDMVDNQNGFQEWVQWAQCSQLWWASKLQPSTFSIWWNETGSILNRTRQIIGYNNRNMHKISM